MRTDVTLRGSKADQFERIQDHLEDRRGHDLSRTDVVGILMAEFEQDLEDDRRRHRSRP
ncbi:hypothetical protein [Natrinema hispanicum]|uniref:Uncharacterized protein n=1 Tax=Natrinema hispanicum TaxID=392421 RepID=A0A1H9YMT5_9EURY|nr:hypothetical protein [Natrinema hispanicum]SES70432.1 hypothetical protein SAMN04488694_101174 [Natrinema hispanicum]